MRQLSKVLAGVALTAATFAALAGAIESAQPTRDLTVDLPGERLSLPDGSGELTGEALPGTDLDRVHATLDDAPVELEWQGRRFRLPLADLTAGAHLVRLGVRHRGGVVREVTVPVLAGPFGDRDAWIDDAFVLRVSADTVDDGDASTDGDLAAALTALILRKARPTKHLGRMRACPLQLTPDPESPGFVLAARAVYERGSLSVRVPLRLERRDDQHLGLDRTGPVRVHVDERIVELGRHEGGRAGARRGAALGSIAGPVGAPIGALVGWALGRRIGAREAPRRISRRLTRVVDGFLPDTERLLELPATVPLDPEVPDVWVELRFGHEPRFDAAGALRLGVAARVQGDAGLGGGEAPLAYPADATGDDGGTGLRVHPALLARLLDAYAESGALEARLRRAVLGEQGRRRVGPLELRDLELAGGALLVPSSDGGVAWVMPDVSLAAGRREDARAFVRGTMSAELADDGGALVTRFGVEELAVSCRTPSETGWLFSPCFGDATALVPDLPERISAQIPELRLFGGALESLAQIPLSGDGGLVLGIVPRHVDLGGPGGSPSLDIGVDVSFSVPIRVES